MDNIRIKAENAVRQAGRLFIDVVFDKDLLIKEGTANFATQIDLLVQEFLMKELTDIIPGSNIITEETNDNRYNLDTPTWILDPVDGTINLYHSYNHSAISLALFIEQKPVLGIIYNPIQEEMFTAEAGIGAFLNNKSIRASGRNDLRGCLVSFGTTPYDRSKAAKTFEIVKDVFLKCQDLRRSGSAALDIAYVACGRTDGFFEETLQPWDYAAGILILKEAGGEITNWEGRDLGVFSPHSVLATNGHIHRELLNLVSR